MIFHYKNKWINILFVLAVFLSLNSCATIGYRIDQSRFVSEEGESRNTNEIAETRPKIEIQVQDDRLIAFLQEEIQYYKETRVNKRYPKNPDQTTTHVLGTVWALGNIGTSAALIFPKSVNDESRFLNLDGNPESVSSMEIAVAVGMVGLIGVDWLVKTAITRERIKTGAWQQDGIGKIDIQANPIANQPIVISIPSLNWQKTYLTDTSGKTETSFEEFLVGLPNPEAALARDIETVASTNLNNQSLSSSLMVAASQFKPLVPKLARLQRELPCDLVTTVAFSDEQAYLPNNQLDAGEQKGKLLVKVRNQGKGIGFDVQLQLHSDNPEVELATTKSLGHLAPKEEKTVTIPLQTSLQAKDGFAKILVETKEKRGFDAEKAELQISVAHLDAPKLEITSLELNDQTRGRAQGNGNGIPENDETIELIAYIKNNGVGDAIAAKLELVEINSGVSVLERSMDLGTIRPDQTVKGTLLFYVPRKFNAEQLKYQLRVSEIRGVGTAEKTETIAMSARQPILAYSIKPPDVLHNGEQVAFELIPKNQGSLDAKGVNIRLSAPGASITPKTFELGDIPAGRTWVARQFVVDLPRTYPQKELTLHLQMTQSGFPAKSSTETYPVELLAPKFIVTDRFIDENGNQVIEQGEQVEVELTVTNRGRLEGQSVRLSVDTSVPDVRIAEAQRLVGTLPPNTTSNPEKFIFTLPRAGEAGDFPITVTITQSEFTSVTHRVNYTIAAASPILGVTALFVDEDKDGRIEQGENVDVVVTVTNTGKQDALNAKVQFSTTTPKVVIAQKIQSIDTLSPNKSETVTFSVTIPRGVPAGAFPLEVKVTHAEFAPVFKTLNYTIYETGVATTVVEAKQPSEQPQTPAIGNKPPTILPTNITDNQTLYSANFGLRVSVSDDRRLASVTAKLNGRPVYNSQTDPNAMEQLRTSDWRMMNFNQPLTLQQGANVLVISAVDSDNEREEMTLHLKYNPRATVISQLSAPFSDVDVDVPKGKSLQQNGVALVIGIEKYQHISDALYADRDAIAFRQYLINLFGFKEENIVLLLNNEATKGGISRGLRKLSDWCEPTSDVIVYYAGHGLPTADGKQQFLIPSDGDPNYLDDETAYALSAFYQRLSQLKARSVTMFMDACFSGTDREENLIVDARPVFQVIEGPGAYPNLEVLASSAGSELSASFPEKRHGMFTYYLLKGLRGEADLDKDGAIKLTEIEKFVQENVFRETQRKGRPQTPTLMGQKKERVLVSPVQKK